MLIRCAVTYIATDTGLFELHETDEMKAKHQAIDLAQDGWNKVISIAATRMDVDVDTQPLIRIYADETLLGL